MLKRTEESKLTSWYFEIDRRLLVFLLGLVVLGIIFVISAGSVSAERIGEPWYYFLKKMSLFYVIGVSTLFVASMLTRRQIMGLSVINVIVGLALLMVTVVAPHYIKGSARFVSFGFFNIMPSDIMKPGFIMLTAWFLATMQEKYGHQIFLNKSTWRLTPLSWWSYLVVFVPALIIIFLHPDVGTTALYVATLGAMLFMAGLPWIIVAVMGGVAVAGGLIAFLTMSHVHNRVIAFLTGDGNTYQIRQSVQSIQHGGLLGSGDDSFVKQSLPDAHTDFIFAAIVEDWGAIAGCVLLGVLLYVLKRMTTDAMSARDPFVFYAVGGTTALFGVQMCINLMTTLNMMPPKGMTLPFISYGGSSFLAFCLLFGMMLALVRSDKWK